MGILSYISSVAMVYSGILNYMLNYSIDLQHTCSNIITDVISKVRELPTLVRGLPQIARQKLAVTKRERERAVHLPKSQIASKTSVRELCHKET